MKVKLLLFLITVIIASSCKGQNSVKTNEIIRTSNNKFGVKSQSGRILIDTVYNRISMFHNLGHKTLPPSNKIQEDPVEFYVVRNEMNQLALFDQDGKIVFDFIECFQLEVDNHTKTVVKIVMEEDNQPRSYLYRFNGKQLFKESFENVGYINHSDLIALIVEDGRKDEYYLYNPFTNNKLGPYDHFNIYNKDSSPYIGMTDEYFDKYRDLNVITVRRKSDSEYIWGMIDMEGNEILPLEYSSIKLFTEEDKKHPFYRFVEKPENVDFIMSSTIMIEQNMKTFYYDKNLVRYEQVNDDPQDPYGRSRRIIKSKTE